MDNEKKDLRHHEGTSLSFYDYNAMKLARTALVTSLASFQPRSVVSFTPRSRTLGIYDDVFGSFRLRSKMTANDANETKERRLIKGVLFDMDGTLLDTEPLGCKAVYLTLKDQIDSDVIRKERDNSHFVVDETNNFYAMPWELKRQTLGLPGPSWSKLVLEYAKQNWGVEDPPSVEEFLLQWDRHHHSHLDQVGKCDGAAELVDNLYRRKLPLAIATSSKYESVKLKRQQHEDMFAKIHHIVATDDPAVTNGKPAPDIYLEAARRINVDPTECIVFEDGLPGVKAGKAAGCFVVVVPDQRLSEAERVTFEQQADLVLDSLSDFDFATVKFSSPQSNS